MIKALISRKVTLPSLSWLRNSAGAQSKFSENNDHQEHKHDDDEQPRSYKPLDGCPHSWFERLGLVTTAVVVGLRTHKGPDTHRPDEDVKRKRSGQCIFNKIFNNQYLLLAHPGAKLTSVLPEKGDSKIRLIESEQSSSIGATETCKIEKLIAELESTSNEYSNHWNNVIAMAYLENNEPILAMKLLQSCQSSAKAMFNLGLIFEMGKHDLLNRVPDYKQALSYYKIASSLGHKYATYNMALIYLYGKGQIENDEDKANTLLIKAAELGVDEAKAYVGENLMKDEQRKSTNYEKTVKATAKAKEAKMTSSSSAPNLLSFFSNIKISKETKQKRTFAQESRCDRNFGSNTSLEVCFVN